jgi:hypothetical protein
MTSDEKRQKLIRDAMADIREFEEEKHGSD